MRKILALFLSLLLSALLVACAKSDSSQDSSVSDASSNDSAADSSVSSSEDLSSDQSSASDDGLYKPSGITKCDIKLEGGPDYLRIDDEELLEKLSQYLDVLSSLEPTTPPSEDVPTGTGLTLRAFDEKGANVIKIAYHDNNGVSYDTAIGDPIYFVTENGETKEFADYLKSLYTSITG